MEVIMDSGSDSSNREPELLVLMFSVRRSVSRGCGEVSVRVSDQGGGIPRDQVERAWHYNYSTASPAHGDRNVLVPGIHAHPMAGLGYGLPLSRVYARYFQAG